MEVNPLYIGKIEIVNISYRSDDFLKIYFPGSLLNVQENTLLSSYSNIIVSKNITSEIVDKFLLEIEDKGKLLLSLKFPLVINLFLKDKKLMTLHYSDKEIFCPWKSQSYLNEKSSDDFSKILFININKENHVEGFKYEYIEPIFNELSKALKDISKATINVNSGCSRLNSIVENSIFNIAESKSLGLTKKCINLIMNELRQSNKHFDNFALYCCVDKTDQSSPIKLINEDVIISNAYSSTFEKDNVSHEETSKKHKNKSYHHLNTNQVINILKQYITLKRLKNNKLNLMEKLSNITKKQIKQKTIDSYLCLFRKLYTMNSEFLNFLECSIGCLQQKVKKEWKILKASNFNRKSTKLKEFTDWILTIPI